MNARAEGADGSDALPVPPHRRRVLVTGATGFLGRAIITALATRADVDLVAACRRPERLPAGMTGEVRAGDLRDADYRAAVVDGIDVICHAGTWGAFWGHAEQERREFFQPTRDLLDRAISSGVHRFIQTSTVAVAARPTGDQPVDDFAPTRRTGFWPHLDLLIDLDAHMRRHSGRGTQMVTMRLGHFAGAGNALGMVPALVPRLRTRLVPWLAGGRARLPLVADTDLGEAFALAATAEHLDDYESFNIVGPTVPTAREVIEFIADETGSPRPAFSVPYTAGYAFAWLMETLHPVLPGPAPFLTRSLVHVSENWNCRNDHATRTLGYTPRKHWRTAVRASLAAGKAHGHPWPRLAPQT
ncbi:NAD(P)-dependent oxidoreductase [Streptomyces sp. JJ36]|uniref:NAD-dependent epimerase/dehydratase family protein n=1 Tax=Streptomyces sp. JJ36 TaxID=2736645 RepID=UPI001F346D09|nr:NAD(P)-dependent oxidoreductase [Streptomyces sp. JJ36]MCF6524801.1 NAD(P)-dependent oxidoreductase [Streptomyces sp. JJ36]